MFVPPLKKVQTQSRSMISVKRAAIKRRPGMRSGESPKHRPLYFRGVRAPTRHYSDYKGNHIWPHLLFFQNINHTANKSSLPSLSARVSGSETVIRCIRNKRIFYESHCRNVLTFFGFAGLIFTGNSFHMATKVQVLHSEDLFPNQ